MIAGDEEDDDDNNNKKNNSKENNNNIINNKENKPLMNVISFVSHKVSNRVITWILGSNSARR
jgi:hypothetical protein